RHPPQHRAGAGPPGARRGRGRDGIEVRASAVALLLTAFAPLAAPARGEAAPRAHAALYREAPVRVPAASSRPPRVAAPTRASAWIARLVARTPAWDEPRAAGSPHMLEPQGAWTGGP